ncbi:MAG: adenylyltransferase/cytidyltransferase family protein [Gammaproteobacteria bacterium]|nr:adenylyltransferase/cytidyltransferase family protein [Gammaproteobacteria bacterium]
MVYTQNHHLKIALVTGGFDPLHSGHIKYISSASKQADNLVVGVNSDEWLIRKKGNYFLPQKERIIILKALSLLDDVIIFDDNDGTAIDAINKLKIQYQGDKIIFCNGGDRNIKNIPEYEVFSNDRDVEFKFGVGGIEKINSSSEILDKWSRR